MWSAGNNSMLLTAAQLDWQGVSLPCHSQDQKCLAQWRTEA